MRNTGAISSTGWWPTVMSKPWSRVYDSHSTMPDSYARHQQRIMAVSSYTERWFQRAGFRLRFRQLYWSEEGQFHCSLPDPYVQLRLPRRPASCGTAQHFYPSSCVPHNEQMSLILIGFQRSNPSLSLLPALQATVQGYKLSLCRFWWNMMEIILKNRRFSCNKDWEAICMTGWRREATILTGLWHFSRSYVTELCWSVDTFLLKPRQMRCQRVK